MLSCFFFNDTATTEIYTLSLHDALPIYREGGSGATPVRATGPGAHRDVFGAEAGREALEKSVTGLTRERARYIEQRDRKSTRLNSSHANISYAVFCLKKKTKNIR